MISVTVGTNTDRRRITVDPSMTIRQVLDEQGVNYSVANVHLDGVSLQLGDMDKTFADLGITESCFLIAVVKADNATTINVDLDDESMTMLFEGDEVYTMITLEDGTQVQAAIQLVDDEDEE